MQTYYEEKRDVYEQVLNYYSRKSGRLFTMPCLKITSPKTEYTSINIFPITVQHVSATSLKRQQAGNSDTIRFQISHYTYRQLLDQFLPGNSWSGFGIKLALGIPCDRKTTFSQKMFLPAYLQSDMAKAVLVRDGDNLPFSQPMAVLYKAPVISEGFSLTSPAMVVLTIFLRCAGTFLFI